MKRFFFSLIALAAAAASCTQSALVETPDLFGTEITFNPYTGRTPVTKATEVKDVAGLAAAGGFNVLAFKTKDSQTDLFMDEAVDLVGSEWKYEGRMYWPDDNGQSTLAFAAYSSNVYGADGSPNTDDDLIAWTEANKKFKYTVPSKITRQIDLLATNYQAGLTLENNKSADVNLQFNHLLSKIGFKLVANNDNQNVDVIIKSVVFEGDFPQSGSVDVTSEAVSIIPDAASGTASYQLLDIDNNDGVDGCFAMSSTTTPQPIFVNTVMPTEDITETTVFTDHSTKAANELNRYMMVMPHNVTATTADKITVTYQITDAAVRTAEIILPTDLEFKASSAYEFVLKVSTSTIDFSVEEYEWGDGANDEDPFPVIPDDDVVQVTSAAAQANNASVNVKVSKGSYETVKIQYRLKGTNTWTDGPSEDYSNSTIDYSFSLESLRANDEYEIHAVVVNEQNETVYSSVYAITTSPKVTTNNATEIAAENVEHPTKVTAKLNGSFPSYTSTNPTGNGDADVTLYFMYGDSESALTEGKDVELTSGEDFSSVITGLEPNKTYYFQAYAKNAGAPEGVGGGVKTFTTPVILPYVTTDKVDQVKASEATFAGTLVSNGGDANTVTGFIYGTSENIQVNTSGVGKVEVSPVNGKLSATVALERFTKYYMKAYATNSKGTSYGDLLNFKTPAEAPILTAEVTDYSKEYFTITGSISDRGAADIGIECILEYGTAVNSAGEITTEKQTAQITLGTGDTYSYTNTTKLAAGTTYYLKVSATNEDGKTTSSPIMSFTTPDSDEPIEDWVPGGTPIN